MRTDTFLWCAGIEDTFISDPYIKTGKTLDEYELTDHYRLWKQDFQKVHELGIDALRWGIPWYRVQPKRNSWDWSWSDQVLPYLVEELHIDPILDLMHYGTPLWLENSFLNPDYPQLVEEYTNQVIERYGHLLHMATPFNEPHTAAEFAGRKGQWPPYQKDYSGYLAVYKSIMRGTIRQTRVLQQANITNVQVECSGGSLTIDPFLKNQACIETTVQSMFYDFLTGDFSDLESVFPFFNDHGLTDRDLSEFTENPPGIDVMGINFYPQFSFQDISYDGNKQIVRENHLLWTDDLLKLLHARYEKYHCPMMITETSIRDDNMLKAQWLQEATDVVSGAYRNGFPIHGFTWFPIIDMYDWEYRVNEGPKEDFQAKFGFWNQKREAYCCVDQFRSIIQAAKEIRQ